MHNRWQLAALAAIAILLGSLLLIGVSGARITAQKMQSQNYLKQIGLAVHNYESAYKSFPAGCDIKENHGWFSFIFPYMEASDWHTNVDFDIAWEHPVNQHQFKISIASLCVPEHARKTTREGYGITGYHGNPALLFKGSGVRFSELTAGLSNVWLAGEIKGNHTPFGYPYNWRELNAPLCAGADSFGAWADGATFVLADGSVKFLSNTIDPTALHKMAKAATLPEKSLYKTPDRRFALASHRPEKPFRFMGESKNFWKGGPPCSEVWLAADGTEQFIDFVRGSVDVEQVIKKYPRAKILRIGTPQNQTELQWIISLEELETLVLLSEYDYPGDPKPIQIETDELLHGLQQLPKLKYLKLRASAEDLLRIKERLPHCQVVPSSTRAPQVSRRQM